MKDLQLAHDVSSSLAKIRTILSLMKESSLDEIRAELLPMAESCAEELKKNLEQLFKK